jgi:hypothetical protein
LGQPREVVIAETHQLVVRAGVEGDLSVVRQHLVDLHRHVMKMAKPRHGASLALREAVAEFAFVRHSLGAPAVHRPQMQRRSSGGSSAIAVGMATNIPPHNLTEIIETTIALIQNPVVGQSPDRPFHGEVNCIRVRRYQEARVLGFR